jgi:hypothetical protein
MASNITDIVEIEGMFELFSTKVTVHSSFMYVSTFFYDPERLTSDVISSSSPMFCSSFVLPVLASSDTSFDDAVLAAALAASCKLESNM